MRISVAMATHNGSSHLSEQLASISAQTRAPDELMVYDDCSTDSSPTIIDEFAMRVPFAVRRIGGPSRVGSARAFERALLACRGDVLVLCDQDDVWRPAKLESIERAFDRDDRSLLVFSDGELVDEKTVPLGRSLWQAFRVRADTDDLFAAFLHRPQITGCSLAYRSHLNAQLMPFPDEICGPRAVLHHDGWISIMAAASGACVPIHDRLVEYRIHPGQQIGLSGWAQIRLADRLRGMPDLLADQTRLLDHRLRALAAVRARIETLSPAIAAPRLATVDRLRLHLLARRSLPRRRVARIRSILREWRTGNYSAFSSGFTSVGLDLLRPSGSSQAAGETGVRSPLLRPRPEPHRSDPGQGVTPAPPARTARPLAGERSISSADVAVSGDSHPH